MNCYYRTVERRSQGQKQGQQEVIDERPSYYILSALRWHNASFVEVNESKQGMGMNKKTQLLNAVTSHYLNSGDFNGFPIRDLDGLYTRNGDLKKSLASLIRENKISLLFPDTHSNPYIKALPEEPNDRQIKKLYEFEDLTLVCAYPTAVHLAAVIDAATYQDRPFTLRLMLGEPQLSFVSFDLIVLEFYRNDPRYYYEHDDISGSISVHSEYYESDTMASSDQVLLQTFGFSYNSGFNRAVAVFLRYLSNLSPQHQQIWNARVINDDYRLHPDYYRSSFLGEWYEGVSIFNAVIEELHQINEISKLMGRSPLFRNEFTEGKRPKDFGFLIRPTLKEYNDFILLLDKMLSDNINRRFFRNDVSFEREEVREDGRIAVTQKGTIQVLEEWFKRRFRTTDTEMLFSAFKEVRRQRQHPAHSINENIFDPKYIREQREVMLRVHQAVSLLREAFAFHPSAQNYEVPDWLTSGIIWSY